MSEVPYKKIVGILLDRFPEFLKSEHFNEHEIDLPYIVWGGFGTFVTNYIQSVPEDRLDCDPLVSRVFELANELVSNGDAEVRNLVVIELFENFYGQRK